MSDLQKAFEDAVDYVKNSEGNASNEEKLAMYALFKQATEGDVSGKRPGMLDMVGRAKYDAWAKLKGTGKDDAMQSYVDRIESSKG